MLHFWAFLHLLVISINSFCRCDSKWPNRNSAARSRSSTSVIYWQRLFACVLCRLRSAALASCYFCNDTRLQVFFCLQGIKPQRNRSPGLSLRIHADIFEDFFTKCFCAWCLKVNNTIKMTEMFSFFLNLMKLFFVIFCLFNTKVIHCGGVVSRRPPV